MNRVKNVLLFAVAMCIVACTQVDTGHVGAYSKFGEILPGTLKPGAYWAWTDYNPTTTDIVQLDVRTQSWAGKSAAYTKDVQLADIQFTLNYHLDPLFVDTVLRTVGEDWAAKLVGQDVHQQIKREIGQYEAVDLIANQNKAATEIDQRVRESLSTKHIMVDSWRMTNIDYSHEFELAVEAKVVAQQKAIEEQNRSKQVQEQANQTVMRAKAEAESISIRANALERNAKLVEWEAVQKWDGKLPTYTLGGNALPFIQIPAK